MPTSHIRVKVDGETYPRSVLRSDIQELQWKRIQIRGEWYRVSESETHRLNDTLNDRGYDKYRDLTQHEFETVVGFMAGPEREYYTRGNVDALDWVSISYMDLSCRDLRRLRMSNSRVDHVDFSGADLSQSTMANTHFSHCTFDGANLNGLKASGAKFLHCTLYGVSLAEYPDLEGVDWEDSKGISALYIPRLSSRGQSLHMVHPRTEDGPVMFQAGCQFLTLSDFIARVEERKADGKDHPYVRVATLLAELNRLDGFEDADYRVTDDYDDEDDE
jgi:hypothetical protein